MKKWIFLASIVGVIWLGYYAVVAKHRPDPMVERQQAPVVKVESEKGLGTGFMVAPDLIATAYHVVNAPGNIVITFRGGGTVSAHVMYFSDAHDLALLMIEPVADMPLATLDCRHPEAGEVVSTVGFPGRLPYVITYGKVASADPYEDGTFVLNLMVVNGNSGGPVYDKDGEVIGLIDGSLYLAGSPESLATMVSSEDICNAMPAP